MSLEEDLAQDLSGGIQISGSAPKDMDELSNELDKELATPNLQTVPIGSNAAPVNSLDAELQSEIEGQQQDFEKLGRSRFGDAKIEEWKKTPISFTEAKNFLDVQDVVPLGGLSKAKDIWGIYSIGKKIDNGEEITKEEENTLNAFIDKTVEMRVRGFSIGGGIAYYGAQMPAFMAEFAATAGAVSAIKGAALKVGTKAVEQMTFKAVGAGLAKTALGSSAIYSRYEPQYAERRLNDFMAITDKGEAILKNSDESPAKSALMASAYTAITFGTEATGPYLGKFIINPVTNVLKTPCVAAINKASPQIQRALYDAYKAIKPNASVSKFFSTVGFHGALEEMGENRVQDVLNGFVGLAAEKGYSFDDYLNTITPSPQQLATEAGIISLVGGTRASANILMNRFMSGGMSEEKAKEHISNLSANETDAIAEKMLVQPKSEYIKVNPENPTIGDLQLDALAKKEPPPINDEESNFNYAYRRGVDVLDPINNLVKAAEEKGANIKGGENPYLLARTYSAIGDYINQTLQVGTFSIDANGNTKITGKALKPILDDFDNKILVYEPDIKQRRADLQDYLVSRRMIEDISTREDLNLSEEQLLSEVGKAKEKMTRVMTKYGENTTWFDNTARELYDYQRRVGQLLVDSGLMTQEKWDGILKKNPNYIPFNRVFEEDEEIKSYLNTKGVFTGTNADKIIKKLEGSTRDVDDVFKNVMMNTSKIISMSRRNTVAKSISKLSNFVPEYVQKLTKEEAADVTNKITFFENGEKQYYAVSKPIMEAVQNMQPVQLDWLGRRLSLPVSILRAGATLIPDFWISNAIRDFITTGFQVKNKINILDLGRAVFDMLGSEKMYNQWKRSGGAAGTYLNIEDYIPTGAFYKDIVLNEAKWKKYAKNPINIPAKASTFVEEMTRLAVFSRAKKSGLSDIDAAMEAREGTLDFSRHGDVSQVINRYMIPFFNAGVQSADKMARIFKENPKAAVLHGLTSITLPSVLLTGYYLYAAPDDEREEYLNFPEWLRDVSWVQKIGDVWIKTPKPFSWGYIFASIPEKIMLSMYNGEDKLEAKERWMEMIKGLAGSVSPVGDPSAIIPQFLKPILEATTNYNFFMGRPIYPDYLDQKIPELRYTSRTSETAKKLGAAFNMSPALIDNTIRTTFAGAGQYAIDASDFTINSIRKASGQKVVEKPSSVSQIPVVRRFVAEAPTGYNAERTQIFMDNFNKLKEIHNSIKSMPEEEKQQFVEEHQGEIQAYSQMKGFDKQISSLNKQIKTIFADTEMTADEKKDQIKDLNNQILNIAREGNKVYDEIRGENVGIR